MATTFKFGNGNWAVKEDYALAYNDENGNFKPLPFDFTRASSATRVNKDGLVETVPSGKPRIDFTDNTSGHLLLEPSRTNYSIYSEDTSTWTYVEFGSGSAGTITTGKTDMFGGTNAVQIDFPADAENVSVRFGHTTSGISSGSAQTSLYIKLVGSTTPDKIIQLRTGSDAENTTISGDSFVRYTKTHTKASNESFNLKLRPSEGTSSGGFSIIVCHPQEEEGSYATSYIPTEGLTETRSAEVADESGNSTVFNDSEGVFYAEIAALADDGTARRITISDGTNSNRVVIAYHTVSNQFLYIVVVGNSVVASNVYTVTDTKDYHKVAVKYKENDFAFWVDGVERHSDSSGSTFPNGTLDQIQFTQGAGGGVYFYGKTKDLRVYDTALSDSELQALTS